ncbi:GAF domain-like protein [Saitoella complicata NRRL Y-17804]|uniref:GAF domain-containing protein n=1 Tax=Saitoella complicata (strain BCRC 22490 / CBS 7301 / JCM 7358 / NBRC 10748 / NRRL Y-17804) TaxID=698492 RepID=A0A0E9NKQ9_SAICN|nr:GAF domain-like protein [Saitoella complicata NRRL Y-17804]ODQ52777.1 GAF domain-like protein [Saitoella complicata NRRL Y-17804]GAO50378.1 hypothetical protein G7K_4505-t1 [Saitoella complicata NRRL Y-17804]
MPHADLSMFPPGQSKEQLYQSLLENAQALLEDQRNWVANCANVSSLVWHGLHSLPSPSDKVNWAGFYVRDRKKPEQLILGPFMGKIACQTIRLGKGVCGTAAATGESQLVPDVEAFPGHIACDGETLSEIVVPVRSASGDIVGVLDLDCEELKGFDEVDQKFLEHLAELVGKGCDWE